MSKLDGADDDILVDTRSSIEYYTKALGVKMSEFLDLYAKAPNGERTLADLVYHIRDGYWRAKVEWVRNVLDQQGEEVYKEAKKQLPAVSVSGVISGRRRYAATERRLIPTGLIQGDCDAKANPTYSVAEMKEKLISTGYFIAVWTSPSGKGVKAIARISKEPDDHLGCFLALQKLLADVDLVLDPDTKDATRLMLVSYDPDLWINHDLPPVLQPIQQNKVADPEAGEQLAEGADADEVQEILSFIPRRPSYDVWARIAWAVFNILGLDRGLPLLREWSPEEKPGEYQKLYDPTRKGKKAGLKTLIKLAKANGYDHTAQVPKDVLPVPGGGIPHMVANRIIFQSMGATRNFFIRESTVVEVKVEAMDGLQIMAVTPERLIGHVEKLGKRVARREANKKRDSDQEVVGYKWRSTTYPIASAKVSLQSQEAHDLLPPLRQIVNAPVIVPTEGRTCKILAGGYHPEGGGTFVGANLDLEDVPGGSEVAASLLKFLLQDFYFASESDRSRAVACMISPALKAGGWIAGDYPLDFAEAEHSQSGKTYRQRLVSTLYNEIPTVITARSRGVGSIDESVGNALLSGRNFIALDNMRGPIDSPLLETALRGHGVAECRGFRANGRVDLSPFNFQLSTNGAELTRDLANRACIIRIKKQHPGYKFKEFNEGDLLAHVREKRGLYLSAVFEIIRVWAGRGRPTTDESRHDFREWARALDWIVQNLCRLPPLLDGHTEQQQRAGDPKLQWLRDILLAATLQGDQQEFTTSQLVDIAEGCGIDFPGTPSRESGNIRAGRILGQIFGREELVMVDGFQIVRRKSPVPTLNGQKDQWRYTVSRSGG